MKPANTKPAVLALALAVVFGGGIAGAQEAKPVAKTNAASQAELAAARKDLERAAKRVAELSHAAAPGDQVHRIERRVVRKPVVGVLLAPDPKAGVRIAGVTPDSAAAKAGLRSGDRIVSIDGTQVLGSSGELRVENARKLLGDLDTKKQVKLAYLRDGRNGVVSVTPQMGERVIMLPGMDGDPGFTGNIHHGPDRMIVIDEAAMEGTLPGVAPHIRRELIRMGPGGECKGENCKLPMLAEAFRWNGLNLASVDAKLGRYFGTDRGVLVLSSGPDLAGLQAGDVIHKVDGKAVGTPREAMAALRDKPAHSLVAIEYLRDRKPGSAKVKVPEAMPLRVPAPPRPPKPPATPAPPAPPPPPGTAFEEGMSVDEDHVVFAFSGALPANAPLPPDAPEIIEEIELRTYR
jgi:membrane-associated protease RseP (regulator of RpoE activity)